MRFLIDIGHPAHVHYFKNLAKILESRGHEVFITVKKLSSAIALLNSLGFKYIVLPEKTDSIFGKALSQIQYNWILLKICWQNKIDIALGVSITISHLSRISKIKSFVFDDDDDDVQPLFVRWGHPYATELVSPDVLKGKQRRKDTIYYPGYHELAYLHPKWFSPDENVLNEIGLNKSDKFFILRFNAFKAHHDTGVIGLTNLQKNKVVEILQRIGKVFITSERELDMEFEQYRLNVSPEKIHSILYYATMFVGDSQTMSSEAAVLGTPSIRCNSLVGKISYLEEEEIKYRLTYGFRPDQFDQLILKIEDLLLMNNLKMEWVKRRALMLEDKIDVTSFWLWLIEKYPKSKSLINDTPEFWEQFK